MQAERWQQVERLCQEALDHPPNERATFLDEACADDEELRREVEAELEMVRNTNLRLNRRIT